MKYSIVVPTYNHCDDLLKPCLESVFQWSNIADIELIISANGCYDNTHNYLAKLQTHFDALGLQKHFQVIWNNQPLGFSRAVNEGIKVATCDKIILLSNDVILQAQPKNNWLDRLAAPFATKDNCGITCSVKMHSEHAGRAFAIFYCVMIHRKVFDKIGLLNESYGVGSGEDIEFSIETELAGFEVVEVSENRMDHNLKMWVSDFPLYHKGEGTVHDPALVQNWDKIFTTNMCRVAQKYNPSWIESNRDKIPPDILLQLSSKVSPQDIEGVKNAAPSLFDEIFRQNCYGVQMGELTDKTVIDIGAHVGTFSAYALVNGAAKVIAVEANRRNFDTGLLPSVKNLSQITPIHLAITDKDGDVVGIEDSQNNSRVIGNSDGAMQVSTSTLKTLLQTNGVQDDELVLKMDIEGSEFDVLLNTDKDTMRKFSMIYIEMHNKTHTNPAYQDHMLIANHLEDCGFEKIFELPMMWFGYDGTVTPLGVWNQKYKRISQ